MFSSKGAIAWKKRNTRQLEALGRNRRGCVNTRGLIHSGKHDLPVAVWADKASYVSTSVENEAMETEALFTVATGRLTPRRRWGPGFYLPGAVLFNIVATGHM